MNFEFASDAFAAAPKDASAGINLIPWPKTLTPASGAMELGAESRIVAEDGSLLPLANILADEIRWLTGRRLKAEQGTARPGDIGLQIFPALKGEASQLKIDDKAIAGGADYGGVAMASASILQLLRLEGEGGAMRIFLPRLAIEDAPFVSYRGLMVDVARKFHSIETLEQCVILCRFYKARYLQLHLTDDPAFTFPSTAYPQLTAKNWEGGLFYSLEELRHLERFASERGVVIVPEYEMPGHSGAAVRAMPDLFKASPKHHATVNFANDKVLQALDTIIAEMCDVFKSTPYFHIGGDECDLTYCHENPDFQEAFKKYNLKNSHELYRWFVVRMNETVKKQGKKTIVWEGFHPEPKSPIQIPKDIIVMEYECPFYPPEKLAQDGYTFINAAWTPLYIVNKHRWSPDKIYAWDLYTLGQVSSGYSRTQWHKVPPTPLIIGAQMCAWEQPEAVEIASVRSRLPAMSERIWNPQAGRDYKDFEARFKASDARLERLIHCVSFQPEGLAQPGKDEFDINLFHEPMTLKMSARAKDAQIHYTLDGKAPSPSSPLYAGPIKIEKDTVVRAAAFDAAGRRLGYMTGDSYYFEKKTEPNLATGKPVTCSGGTQGPQTPELAVDGNLKDINSSWWAAPWPQWMQVDLLRAYDVDRIQVYPYWDGRRYYQYTVEISADGKEWARVGDMSQNTKLSTSKGDEFKFPKRPARYVRVNVLKNSVNEGAHIVEILVFEAAEKK
ncbi:MAG: family 20 glycosylhydrolase [Candidatus Sumerlaeota bacterium]|nr:family 20 glycosylhydrolase [Candidatus Sumerlaeota bacterium]